MEAENEPIEALVRRFDEDPRAITKVSLSAALRAGQDPMAVIAYMNSLGIEIASIDDLLRINDDEAEEELHAYRVAEGVAVSIASDGLWILYAP